MASKKNRTHHNLDLYAAGVAILSVLVQGHRFGEGTQEALLLGVARVLDLTWLVNDWFLSVPQMRGELIGILAMGSRTMGEPTFFLLLHLVTRFALLAGTWRLVEALLPGNYRVALMTLSGVLFMPLFFPGALDLMTPHWEPANLGAALVIWLVAEGIRVVQGRGNLVGMTLLGGLAMFFTPWMALPAVVALALFHWYRRQPPKETALVVLGALFLSSPGWIPFLAETFRGGQFLADRSFIRTLQFHDPDRFQPWTWPVFQILQAVLILAAAVVGWWRFLPAQRRPDLMIFLPILAWILFAGIAWTVASFLEVAPELILSDPLRLMFLPTILVFALAVALVFQLLEERTWYLAVGGSLVLLLPWHDVTMCGPILVALTVVWFPLLGVAHSNAGVMALSRWCRPVGWLAVALGIFLVWGIQTREAWREQLVGERWLVAPATKDEGRQALVEWIRINTPREAVFAIPPTLERFRLLEQRSIVVDLTLAPQHREQLAQWVERVSLGTNAMVLTSRPERELEDVSVQQLVLLAQTHGARYVVVRENLFHPVVVHRIGGYSILDLERDGIILNNW
ncbi:MAG: hypothetical protein JJU11_10325 [Candidatus Sumerlaeia bacterium]|nr:hypothetical protein [Candidatus Sumerlaeia bacterium]